MSSSNHHQQNPNSHEVASVIATKAPSQRMGARRLNKFDFDAPQFKDFTHPKYIKTLQILEQVLLPEDKRTTNAHNDWTVNCDGLINDDYDGEVAEDHGNVNSSQSNLEDDGWFERVHSSHEPTSPFSPTGPLISSPNNDGGRDSKSCTSPLVRGTPAGATPQSMVERSTLGIRSRPMRVPLHGSVGSSQNMSNGSRSSYQSINSSNNNNNNSQPRPSVHDFSSDLGSPLAHDSPTGRRLKSVERSISRWKISQLATAANCNNYEARSSNSIETSIIEERSAIFDNACEALPKDSSAGIPISTNWSSIPETPPILAATRALLEESDQRKRSLPITPAIAPPMPESCSNINHANNSRRLGQAGRIIKQDQNLLLEVGKSPLGKQPATAITPLAKKRVSPIVKRMKVDMRFCPAPIPKSRNASPPKQQPTTMAAANNGKKEKPVKIDDLKKLLAVHNQKLRPNVGRRR